MAVILFKKLRTWLSTRRIWCNAIAATVALVICAPITYMALDRDAPFRLRNGYTIPAQIPAGSVYKTSWEVMPGKYCPGSVTVSVVDSQNKITSILSQPSYFVHLGEKGKWTRAESRPRVMPDSVAVGPAKLYITNEFYCNPLQVLLKWPIVINHPIIHTVVTKSD